MIAGCGLFFFLFFGFWKCMYICIVNVIFNLVTLNSLSRDNAGV